MTTQNSRTLKAFTLAVGLFGLAWPFTLAAQVDKSPTIYSGQAAAFRAIVTGMALSVSDTGSLPQSGGAQEASLLEASNSGGTFPKSLSLKVAHASTVGQEDSIQSEASLANLNLTVGDNTISADFLRARVDALCAGGHATSSDRSEAVHLIVNGQAIAVGSEPNQTVDLASGRMIIDERSQTLNDNSSNTSVNALHIILNDGIGEIILASARSGITCASPALAAGYDLATGSGWITGTPTGGKGNFGVAGGMKNGALWGHLNYADNGSNLKVKGTSITAYLVLDPKARRIEGTAEINGQSGYAYQVDVYDSGGSKGSDTFTIRLSNGYAASGNLGGGDIQLH
jgi:hypothetical protein